MSKVSSTPIDFDPFKNGSIHQTVPATESQREIWTSVQFGGDDANCAFNEAITVKLTGQIDTQALQHSIYQLITRHDGLRTTFSPDGTKLVISAEPNLDFSLDDLSSLNKEEQIQQISQLEANAVKTPFNLENGPLFRTTLIKTQNDEHLLLITSHHIICDGWSIWVILEELGTLYAASSDNAFAKLQDPFPFSHYAIEQNKRIDSEQWKIDEEFWIKTFSPPPSPLDLPTTFQRPANRSFKAARKDYIFPEQLISTIKSFAVNQKTTLTVVLLSAFATFLYRISHQDDPIIGVPASGQSASGHYHLVGHCVNLLPIRCKLIAEDSFVSYLARYKQIMLDAFDHQQYTYGTLLKKLNIPRNSSSPPLVPIIFNIDRGLGEISYGNLKVEYYTPPRSYETFELFLNASEINNELHFECQYNTDLFSDSIIKLRLQEFEYFLEQLMLSPQQPLSIVPLLPEKEMQVLNKWNDTVTDLDNICVHNLIEKQAELHPNKPAITFADSVETYQGLNQNANKLARQLQSLNISCGSLVGIYLPRSIDMVVALLAILKTGATYVPLDPNYPEQRIKYMVDNSSMALVITNDSLQPFLPDSKAIIFNLDSNTLEKESNKNLKNGAKPDDVAYVIYTSGSTGNPKGVKVHHRAVVNFLTSMADCPGLNSNDILLAVTTLSFDIAVLEILLPLTTGATVAMASADEAFDGFLLQRLMKTTQATVMQATPATWHMLIASGWPGASTLKILCGGEAMPKALAKKLVPLCKQLWNMYGPTETTIWSTCFQVKDPDTPILIGKPINNTMVYLLDKNLQQVPIGVPAELCIGGDGVTKGYIGRDDLTNKQFITNPLPSHPGEIIYKTGDLVRLMEDGNLEYFNRLDNQVKIRGFRIELGEIESAITSLPEIKQAITVTKQEAEGDTRLIAYITMAIDINLDISLLRNHLRQSLPNHMIPQHFIQTDTMPLTPAGKIDRKALSRKNINDSINPAENVPPETKTEQTLYDIWLSLLKVEQISIHDNFFEIGGHSFLAVSLFSKIKNNFHIELPLSTLFQSPSIHSLAANIDAKLFQGNHQPKSKTTEDKEEFIF